LLILIIGLIPAQPACRQRKLRTQPAARRIQNLIQIVQTRDRAYRQFTLLVSTLAAISLVVGGIGVMNILLVSVAERTNEIEFNLLSAPAPGTSVSNSSRKRGCCVQSAGWSVSPSVTGFARAVPPALGWPVEFNGAMGLVAIASSSVIGIVFGLLPAERAARSDPAAVLRSGQ
jgi:putative ABC transport system permease protein